MFRIYNTIQYINIINVRLFSHRYTQPFKLRASSILAWSHSSQVSVKTRAPFHWIKYTTKDSEYSTPPSGENTAQQWHYRELDFPLKPIKRWDRGCQKAESNTEGAPEISGKYCTDMWQESPSSYVWPICGWVAKLRSRKRLWENDETKVKICCLKVILKSVFRTNATVPIT